MERPSLTLGIEEEYLLVDPETRNLVAEPTPDFFAACRDRLGDRVSPELLQCQIEVGTRPHPTVGAAVAELRGLRRAVAEVAADHGYRVIAASVHPFGRWRRQAPTDKERYEKLWEAMGQPGRRMLICGMHIHAGVEDPEQRITLMNQVAQLLPLLLALSASSPFWQGADTDMASYRLAVYGELPRTGPPDRMASHHAYAALIGIWWRSGRSRTARSSGGTFGPRPGSRRWSSGSPTSAPVSTTWRRWRPGIRRRSPGCMRLARGARRSSR